MKPTIIKLFLILVAGVCAISATEKERPFTSVYGRVSDLWGMPIQGAKLQFFKYNYTLRSARGSLPEPELTQSTVSDERGNYRVNSLPKGDYLITADLSGFRHIEINRINFSKDAHLLEIGMEVGLNWPIPSTEISGTVRKSDQTKLPDATITVVCAYNPQITEQTRTNEQGEYKINLYTPGQYVIYASSPGFEVNAITVTTGDRKTINFKLIPIRRTSRP
jgi:hypothetical protein